ncbi:MAG TPA: citrate transporter [Clostridiales bacterium]|nr:citrate transporter [Clostridiales bacterium]
MAATFVLGSKYLKSTEISMALAGVVAIIFSTLHGWTTTPVKLLVEGLFTNMDLAMTFICATIFINIYSSSGAMTTITRNIVERINNKWLILICMGILMLIPGAITGAGSVSVFVLGTLVYSIVRFMGVSEKKATAFVFMFAIFSAACPPINLWTMLMTAQANMPYVGFELLLLLPIIIAGAFTILYCGWGSKRAPKEEILATLPEVNAKMYGFGGLVRVLLPLLTLVVLFVLTLVIPFSMPVLGLPLMFIICTVVAILCNPNKTSVKEYAKVISDTMEQVFPLVATVLSVGIMQNAMAASGVKGLIGTAFVLLPFVWIYALILIVGPFAQGSMSYGSAVVIGTPLIFMFNTAGMNVTVVCAALSLIFPIGDCLPPSRIVGRLVLEATDYKDTYTSFLKQIFVPCLVFGLLALIMLIKPAWFTFLA